MKSRSESPVLPQAITSLDDIPLGSVVKKVSEEFDRDPLVRYELLSIAYAQDGERLSWAEVAEMADNLSELRSPVWHREGIAGHLVLLNKLIREIEDEDADEPLIVTPDWIRKMAVLENLRTEWFTQPCLQAAVLSLKKVIEDAMYWFNVQLIAILIQNAIEHSSSLSDYPPCQGLEARDLPRMCTLISDFGYFQGSNVLRCRYGKAVEAVMSTSAAAFAKKLFCFSPKQLRKLAAVSMGAKIDEKEFGIDEQDDTPENIVAAWKKEGSLWVPDKSSQE